MARPRTPSKVLDLKGAFKVNPERRRTNEPDVSYDFDRSAPDYLTDEQKATWDEVVRAIPAGVLSASDLIHVEVVAKLLAEFREDRMETSRISRLTSEMGKLGLNPSARASLSVDKPTKNRYSDE